MIRRGERGVDALRFGREFVEAIGERLDAFLKPRDLADEVIEDEILLIAVGLQRNGMLKAALMNEGLDPRGVGDLAVQQVRLIPVGRLALEPRLVQPIETLMQRAVLTQEVLGDFEPQRGDLPAGQVRSHGLGNLPPEPMLQP